MKSRWQFPRIIGHVLRLARTGAMVDEIARTVGVKRRHVRAILVRHRLSPILASVTRGKARGALHDDPPRAELPQICAQICEADDVKPAAATIPAAPSNSVEWGHYQARFARGAEHGRARLTEQDVREILCMHGRGASIYSLAKAHHVNPGTVRAIVRGETWTHVSCLPSPALVPDGSLE